MRKLNILIQFLRKGFRKLFKRHPALALALKVTLYSGVAIGVFLHFLPKHTIWGYAVHTLITLVVSHSLTDLIWRAVFGPERERHLIALIEACFGKALELHSRQVNRKLDQLVCINKLLRFGIKAIHKRLDYVRLFANLQGGDTLLWLDTFHPTPATFHREAALAVERGASVYMLVQKPHCVTADHRARELQGPIPFTEITYNKGLAEFYDTMAALAVKTTGKGRGEFLVRMYDDLPSVPMYIVVRGGTALSGFNGFFLNEATAYDSPHIEWSRGSILDGFAKYFFGKWEKHQITQTPPVLIQMPAA